MTCPTIDPNSPLPRISGRTGMPINLNVTFYRNGIPSDPFAIRKISIYRSSVQEDNKVAELLVNNLPDDPIYPSPISLVSENSGSDHSPGLFSLIWNVPTTIGTPDIYFDEWQYIPTVPDSWDTLSDDDKWVYLNDESHWQSSCQRFWLYPDSFFVDSGLESIKLGFESIDIKLHQPEIKTIEVGITPLPLYDFDFNFVAPIIPHLRAFISIWTDFNELVIDTKEMNVGIRQGSYRTNPFVLKFKIDSSSLLKGSYKYRTTVCLPNGESRVSPDFFLQIS